MDTGEVKSIKGSYSFTLVELLVVMVVIMILAGMLFPAISSVRTRAREVSARAEMNSISLAIKSYEADYHLLPAVENLGSPPTDREVLGEGTSSSTAWNNNNYNRFIELLSGGANSRTLGNTRGKSFLDPKSSVPSDASSIYDDPWGVRYRIYLDYNYDNEVDHNVMSGVSAPSLRGSVFLISAGKDKEFGTKYDIKSWGN